MIIENKTLSIMQNYLSIIINYYLIIPTIFSLPRSLLFQLTGFDQLQNIKRFNFSIMPYCRYCIGPYLCH